MENRFFEMNDYLEEIAGKKPKNGLSKGGGGLSGSYFDNYGYSGMQSLEWAKSLSAQQRVLVILIENGGVDLGIPDLVDKLISSLHANIIPDSVKRQVVDFLRKQILSLTDNLLETVELTANRYSAAKPDVFGDVIVLRNGTASYQQLKDTLIRLSKDKKIIDLFVLTHGSDKTISIISGDITDQKIRDIKTANGAPLTIRSVYMMNCVGSSLNKAWLDAGARVSSGAIKNNYLPEPTMFFFWSNWKSGQSFETAVTGAYRKTINLMNDAVKNVLRNIPVLSSFADSINFENFDFVKDSAPVIQGQRTLMINSDDLNFSQSLYNSLATTVLPVSVLQSLDTTVANTGNKKPKPWTMSQQGVDLIKKFEGFKSKMYNDPVGHCTIGYGTLLHRGNCNGDASEQPYANGISEDKATKLLVDEANQFQDVINKSVKVELSQNQFDSLLSFIYNIGEGAFQKSTLLTVLNDRKYDVVPSEMKRWTKGRVNGQMVDLPGLVKRREAEAALFQSGSSSTAQSLSFSAWVSQLSAVDYTVPGTVPVVGQPTDLTCWAAVMCSMMSWKKQQSMQIRDALATVGDRYVKMFDDKKILDVNTAKQMYADAKLSVITSFNPTIDGWEGLLKQFGPLYVDIGYPGTNNTHAIIVIAIKGDGTPNNTNITYINPSPGKIVTEPFKNFLAAYEAPGAVNNWPYVIVHWPAVGSVSQSLSDYSFPLYDTGEHAIFGEFINNAVSGPIATTHALLPTTTFNINSVAFTYGQIITMGDFYDTYTDLTRAPVAELNKLKGLIVRSENHYKNSILGIGPVTADVKNSEWGDPVTGIGQRFIDLAVTNNSHFAPPPAGTSSTKANNKQSWELYHSKAIDIARKGTSSAALDQAYPMNAFGDHFLTDAFSAGHLINKELVMNKFINNIITGGKLNSAGDKMFEKIADGALAVRSINSKLGQFETTDFPYWDLNDTGKLVPEVFYRILIRIVVDTAHGGQQKIANLAAKAVHDYLINYNGKKGVPVKNNKGNGWTLTGDGTLNLENIKIIQMAVKQSVENLEDSVRNTTMPLTTFYQKVWDYVPSLTDPTTAKIVSDAVATFTNPSSPLLVSTAVTLIGDELDILLNQLIKAGYVRCKKNHGAKSVSECK